MADDRNNNSKHSFSWFIRSDDNRVVFIRTVLMSVIVVGLIGVVLFSITGLWPPMVSVESGSMEPQMERGDLIVTVENHRYAPDYAQQGVVTGEIGERKQETKFGEYGDVIIYYPDGSSVRTPVIHRAMFWVNESENWVKKANPAYLPAENCSEILNCPAPHSGFITKGDANPYYDQTSEISSPVKSEWVRGTAEVRIPYLGYIRLLVR